MIGIRIHGRGGQGAVTASRLLAEAAYIDGKFSQAIPMYGTERRGAPLTAFVRLDDVRVRERELVHEPDIVVVLDPLLSTQQAVADGLKKELENLPKIFSSKDALEGLKSVIERRRPTYTGE